MKKQMVAGLLLLVLMVIESAALDFPAAAAPSKIRLAYGRMPSAVLPNISSTVH